MISFARLHLGIGVILVSIGLVLTVIGWAPTDADTPHTVPNVRENPASYRPVYIPVSRSSGGGTSGRSTGGGFGSGK